MVITEVAELTTSEKRVLLALNEEAKACDPSTLSEKTDINEDAVMQTAFMLAQQELCEVKETERTYYHLTVEGKAYAAEGLPERRALEFLIARKEATIDDLKTAFGKTANIAINWLLKKNWARIKRKEGENLLIPVAQAGTDPDIDELILKKLAEGKSELTFLLEQVANALPVDEAELNDFLSRLMSRKLVEQYTRVERKIAITESGKELLSRGVSVEEEIAQLTPELIRTGSWKEHKFKRYDVNISSKEVFAAKIHPYQRILDRMRRIFTDMGFTEIKGALVQSAFWNFDALFVPQDHPAREMQDTFYLTTRKPIDAPDELIKNVKEMQEHGGSLNSSGWGGEWRKELGERLLLRTHTTAVTLKYLASHPEPPVKVFSIDRVYRRETIDPTHLPEFDQLEGIVMDKGVTFSNLLGCLATFYRKMGFPSIRFRPGYFPYTEPSVEVEVYLQERGWMELGGAGVFREEVTTPVGLKYPVLAWGLGIGRLAMLSLGLTDIRDLYHSDIDWLRKERVFR
ncbi:Phenylalanine--tRNA ligase alpha subunit [ANME-1 cluster archaeon GoMg2]|nr:Phenylalanine--tRNA ligase alpha subunit [ANME-1 cluster archaeon GoMg2]